jgi:hypothetical protein
MTPEQYEEVLKTLAELVVFVRGQAVCPYHAHMDIALLTKEGPTIWHGPWCESPEASALFKETCEFVMQRDEILWRVYEALGTKDMTNFI